MILLFTLLSCDSQDGSLKQSGLLSLSLKADTTSLKKGVSSGLTKAFQHDELLPFTIIEDYAIYILQGEDTVKSFNRFEEMPSEIKLPEGAYQLFASKGENLPAAFDSPYFEGSTAFTIKEDMVTPLEVTATMANARFSVQYTQEFLKVYSDYTVLLSSSFTTEEIQIGKHEIRPVYMQMAEGGTQVVVGIRLKKRGEEKEKTYYIPTPLDVERRQNVHLIFKTDGAAFEGIGLDVILDDTLEEMTFTTEIPDFMWEQFKEPTLTYPTQFSEANGYEITVQTSRYEEDPLVGFAMPAGVGHLYLKYWLEGFEEDYHLFDLATDEGVEGAKGRRFSWGIGTDETNQNLSNVRKTGSVHLKNAIRSLDAPIHEDEVFSYHFEWYGSDATGKEKPTNRLNFKVNVLAAAKPFIDSWLLPQEIVEGDMFHEIKTKLVAEGQIDTEKTQFAVKSSSSADLYNLSDLLDRDRLKEKYGIVATSEDDIEIGMLIPADFISRLTVPEGKDSEIYTITISLHDQKGKRVEQTRSILVKKPVFRLVSTDADAFAKRVVMRVDLPVGNPDHVSFRYRKAAEQSWSEYKGKMSAVGSDSFEDVLKELTPETNYVIQIVYNSGKSWERVGNEIQVTTESVGVIPNNGFEEWSFEKIAYFEKYYPWNSEASKGWNTLNLKTTQDGSNKWDVSFRYIANSGTISTTENNGGNSAALIRTVGWGKGTTAASNTSVIKHLTPGELYLGEVNVDTKDPVYGYKFSSRPSGFSFDYKYLTKSGSSDKFVAKIMVMDIHGTVIAEQQLADEKSTASSSWVRQEVRLRYEGVNRGLKADKICILFKSSSSGDYHFLRANLMVTPNFGNLSDGEYVGSQLYIDNVELIYE